MLSGVTWQFVSTSGSGTTQAGVVQPAPTTTTPAGTENLAVAQPGPAPDGSCAAGWDASTSYVPGDEVPDSGKNRASAWWSTGAEPGSPQARDVWTSAGSC